MEAVTDHPAPAPGRAPLGPVEISVDAPVPFKAATGLRQLSLEVARRLVRLPGQVMSMVFPRQGPLPPVAILPGYGVEMQVTVKAPGRDRIYLYPETTTVMGHTRLQSSPPVALALDANGVGSTALRIAPEDDRVTGQAALRLVAVDPNLPDEVAGQMSGIMLTQEGTSVLIRSLLVLLICIGLIVQVIETDIPVLAGMIVLATAFMMFNAPPVHRPRFEPRRLLSGRAMARAAGLSVAACLVWSAPMMLNIWAETAATLCDTPTTSRACPPGYAIFDNATTILASVGFAFLMLAAWAPAIRPADLVGRLAIMAGLMPLLVYDLTVIPAGWPDDTVDDVWVHVQAFLMGYPALGWMLGGFGLSLVMLRNRLGPVGLRLLPALVALIGLAVMGVFSRLVLTLPAQEVLMLNEFVTRRAFGLLLAGTLLWVLVRPVLIPIRRGRRWLRWLLGLALLAAGVAALAFGPLAFQRFSAVLGTPNPAGVDYILMALCLQIGLILAAVAETRWRISRQRRRGADQPSSSSSERAELTAVR